jgi:glycosyltransferase involved in cell wall biosynthesis
MRITVAICTYNRAALLDQTLAQVCQLRIPAGVDWELLVINNRCTDDTDAVLARFAGLLPLRRLYEPKPGQSHARNCGLEHVKGDWVLWTDDDVLVEPGWVEAFAGTVARYPEAAAVGGRVDPWFVREPDPVLAEAFPLLRNGFCGTNLGAEERYLRRDELLMGCNMAYRMGFIGSQRFDPALGRVQAFQGGGDDFEYLREVFRRGGKAVWSPEMRVKHYVDPARMTLEYLRRFYYDAGVCQVRKQGVPPGPRLLGMPRWLVRKYLEVLARSCYYRLTFRRVRHLQCEPERWTKGGMLSACREAAAPTGPITDPAADGAPVPGCVPVRRESTA